MRKTTSITTHYIQSLGRSGMKFDLNRMKRILERLGHPQNKFPSIHIAGTNGKGSVAAMMATTLKTAGHLKVGLYTSPHLSRLEERFQINGRLISADRLAALTKRIRRSLKQSSLTQFEFLTALAFLVFAEENVDVAVVEVGLGGRLDATNVLTNVLVSVITTIDFDHTEWLGNTLGKIAREKAGIIKNDVPVVTGTKGEALRVIASIAQRKHAPLTVIPADAGIPVRNLHLQGAHQQHNARIATAALNLLARRFPMSNKAIIRGIQETRWPGRFEIFNHVILDGAHNPAAMKALVQTLRQKKISSVNVLFGALRDKDFKTMIKTLAPFVNRCVTVPVPSERSASAPLLANHPAWKTRAIPATNVAIGWNRLKNSPEKNPILITGSLYLIGAIRKLLK